MSVDMTGNCNTRVRPLGGYSLPAKEKKAEKNFLGEVDGYVNRKSIYLVTLHVFF